MTFEGTEGTPSLTIQRRSDRAAGGEFDGLLIIDGAIVGPLGEGGTAELLRAAGLEPSQIEKIEVIKGQAARILITTKGGGER